ncbi:hypothetical protein BAME_25390 [Bacillus sp. M 2-6]|nr:hypothetical protein BAME_25390 [Bacillus sp. M 2-6]
MKRYFPIPKTDDQIAFPHKEHFILIIMVMPNEFTLNFHHFHV